MYNTLGKEQTFLKQQVITDLEILAPEMQD